MNSIYNFSIWVPYFEYFVDSQIDQNPTRSESTGPIFESQTKTENDDIFDYMFWVYKRTYM